MKFLEWLDSTKGKKVIVTDRISNGNRLIRRYNMEQGKDASQTSCMTITQIAKELVYAWTAFHEPEKNIEILKPESSVYLLEELLRNGHYQFVAKECFCTKTTETILRSLNQIRMNRQTEAYEASKEDKISELKKLIEVYETRMKERAYFDDVLLLKKGLWILEKIKNKKDLSMYLMWLKDCKFGYLEDFEMTALESAFMEKLLILAECESQKLDFFTGKLSCSN